MLATLLLNLGWPALGLIMLIIVSFLAPSPALPGGFNITVIFVAFLLGIWFMRMLVHQKKILLVDSRTTRPLIVFALVSLLVFAFGQLSFYSFAKNAPIDAQIGGLSIYLLSIGAFLLAANLIQELRWLKLLTWVFLVIGGVYIIARIIPGNVLVLSFYQPGAFNGSMFYTWIVALAFSQAIFNDKLSIIWRIALGALVVSTLYLGYGLASSWKAGWIPPLVVVGLIIGLRLRRFAILFIPFGIIFLTQLADLAISTDLYSWETRLDALNIVTEIVKVNPVFGLGFGNYYFYTQLFPIRGWYVSFNSHNQFVDIYAQMGLLGLFCFMWFFWEVGHLSIRLRNHSSTGFTRAYIYGAIGGLGGTLVAATMADWVLPFVYNIGFRGFRASVLAWIFLGGVVSIEQILRKKEQTA
jgi:O-antigen ligase